MTEEAPLSVAGGSVPAGVPAKVHGLSANEGGYAVQFAMAVWPYDLLLRFGYDLPENEHMWPDEWFDDTFETAAFDLRLTGAKLMFAIREMDAAVEAISAATAAGTPAQQLAALKTAVERAPLALDLVLGYLRRLEEGVASVVPGCYGLEGKSLIPVRTNLATLAASAELAALDPVLPALLAAAPRLAVRTSRPDLYVIGENAGFRAALPKAAARALRTSAEVTVAAATEIDACVAATFGWLDTVISQLQAVVAARAEDGPDLLERWAEPNWSALMAVAPGDPLLRHLPAV